MIRLIGGNYRFGEHSGYHYHWFRRHDPLVQSLHELTDESMHQIIGMYTHFYSMHITSIVFFTTRIHLYTGYTVCMIVVPPMKLAVYPYTS